MSATILKSNYAQLLVWAPFGVAGGALACSRSGLAAADSTLVALKIAFDLFAVQPVVLVVRCAAGTRDGRMISGTMGMALAALLVLPIALFMLFGAEDGFWNLLGALFLAGISCSLWVRYRRWYGCGPVDLDLQCPQS